MKQIAVRNLRLCTKDCLCLYVCPTGATDTENSIIDVTKCLGCGICACGERGCGYGVFDARLAFGGDARACGLGRKAESPARGTSGSRRLDLSAQQRVGRDAEKCRKPQQRVGVRHRYAAFPVGYRLICKVQLPCQLCLRQPAGTAQRGDIFPYIVFHIFHKHLRIFHKHLRPMAPHEPDLHSSARPCLAERQHDRKPDSSIIAKRLRHCQSRAALFRSKNY